MIDVLHEGHYWAYEAVVTNTKDVGQTVGLKITPGIGTRLLILDLLIGPDDYASARTIFGQHEDINEAVVRRLFSQSIDNARTQPSLATLDAATATISDQIGFPPSGLLFIAGNDAVKISSSGSLADNETITIKLRGVFTRRKPIVSLAASSESTLTESLDVTY